jgi:hypothetical protein
MTGSAATPRHTEPLPGCSANRSDIDLGPVEP